MSYDHEISVHINTFRRPNYGYPIEFQAQDSFGNPIPLTFISGISGFCFEVISGLTHRMWRDCDMANFTINNSGLGLFEWDVQSGFFNQTGVFEGKVHIKMSGMRQFTLDDLRLSVVGRP